MSLCVGVLLPRCVLLVLILVLRALCANRYRDGFIVLKKVVDKKLTQAAKRLIADEQDPLHPGRADFGGHLNHALNYSTHGLAPIGYCHCCATRRW